ncbi:MAG: OB-fold domain-containing protein [Deltaproteobacteria bacterium]|nr:OB-fold domain-containing protein [Deltaproteobacteria bacterium]
MNFEKPLPVATATSRPFWEALTRHEVQIQQCSACHAWIYYPRTCCPRCLSPELQWQQISGTGTLYSFTIARRPTAPFWADELPQLIAMVELYSFTIARRPTAPFWADELPQLIAMVELDEGPRLTSTLCNVEEDAIRVGMRLQPVFDDIADKNVTLLRYEPA